VLLPRISEFYGIVITMFYNDHPPFHIHARYGSDSATFGIEPVQLLWGRLPTRAQSLVLEWIALHSHELRDNWTRARERRPLQRVPPLV